jgi:hypothetical protein
VCVVAKPRLAIVLLMVFSLGLPLGLAAEDVPETAYDESEAAPYEGTFLFSIVLPVAARTNQEAPGSVRLELGASSLFARACVYDTDANRSADARPSLALLRTLLC